MPRTDEQNLVPESAFVSIHTRVPIDSLKQHMSAIASVGGSATVQLRGAPERIVSFITGLSGRYPAISAQVSVGGSSAATSLSGKTPVL
jgi:hypothetical protein